MGKRSRRPRGDELCVYCGVRPGTTREHVVPRSLFPKPLPDFMVTVGVCSRCNGDKSPLDAYLRDVLVADLASSGSPAADAVRNGTMLRSIQTNRSELARAARARFRIEPLHTPAGLFLGYHPTVPLDGEKVERAFKFMTRGLYYSMRRKRIPDDYTFDIRRISIFHAARVFAETVQGRSGNYRRLDGGVFDCVFSYALEDEYVTHWLLRFYDGVVVTVATEPPNGVGHLLDYMKPVRSDMSQL